jgi:hypothetical protein
MSPASPHPPGVSYGNQFRRDSPSRQAEATPVDPNPPDCRSPLSENAVTAENSGRAIRVKTSWAMRSPGSIVTGRRQAPS